MDETGYERMKRLEQEFVLKTKFQLNHLADNYYNDPAHIAKEAYRLAMSIAVDEIEGWENLLIKAHAETPYANPKEADREHRNTMNLLAVIKNKLRKKTELKQNEVG